MLLYSEFFDISKFDHQALFLDTEYVWDALKVLGKYLQDQFSMTSALQLGEMDSQSNNETLMISEGARVMQGASISGAVYIGAGTLVEPGAYIQGPAYIGQNCEIRHAAYLRGNVLVGNHCVIGHCTEIKNSVLLDNSNAPHFCYVGDSILGNRVNLGAGTKLANLPLTSVKDPISGKRNTIEIRIKDTLYDTGLGKLGAILGDDAMTGCNSVTNPGCLLQKHAQLYPNATGRKGLHSSYAQLK